MTTVTMQHVRGAKMCAGGARQFFKKHDLDWNEFLSSGIDGQLLLDTGDAMAAEVVRFAEDGR